MKNIIELQNIRVYAYHGCLKEEAQIGSDYRVDIQLITDFQKAIQTDELSDTVDYVYLNKIVKEEMAIRSNLIENVAGRICQRIKNDFADYQRIEVKVCKLNPPINGDVQAVCIKIIEEKVA